jgi:hypothetical protein
MRDDEAPLPELAVVLFFLVDILGLLLEPSTNGGRQLLWRLPKLPCTNNESKLKLKNQNHNTKQRTTKKLFTQQYISQKPIPFTSAVRLLL